MSAEPLRGRRRLDLDIALGPESARTKTTIHFDRPHDELRLGAEFDVGRVSSQRIRTHRVTPDSVVLGGVDAGGSLTVEGTATYRTGVHGLGRWVDPVDGNVYVVGSGALGGASRFLACHDGPDDLMPTELAVVGGEVIRTARAPLPDTGAAGAMSSHHLAFVAGPWAVARSAGVEVLTRQSLSQPAHVARLMVDTERVLTWLTDWFASAHPPWGAAYTQVLCPGTPWLGMEHPGCVLISERLLGIAPAHRIAVLAHEAAHQWLGNLVTPGRWRDVGVFEGVAELLGQMVCEDIEGGVAARGLGRHRASAKLFIPPVAPDLRDIAATAGLAEVAGPGAHAELLRVVRAEMGDSHFRDRLRGFVAQGQGSSASAADLWQALGTSPRSPKCHRLPHVVTPVTPSWRSVLTELAGLDPATAAVAARRFFRSCEAGPTRVLQALAVIGDPGTPLAVVAGLGAELAGRKKR